MKNQKKKFVKSDNRKQFEELSEKLKIRVLIGEFENVNAALKSHYYKLGHKELKTFYDWIKEGYTVKKGEKALYLWSKPIPRKAKEGTDSQATEEGKQKFHGIICLFSNLQVEKTETTNHQQPTPNN